MTDFQLSGTGLSFETTFRIQINITYEFKQLYHKGI